MQKSVKDLIKMSEENKTFHIFEIKLVSAKITKSRKFKDSKYIFPSEISEYNRLDKTITKETYDKIKELLDDE